MQSYNIYIMMQYQKVGIVKENGGKKASICFF